MITNFNPVSTLGVASHSQHRGRGSASAQQQPHPFRSLAHRCALLRVLDMSGVSEQEVELARNAQEAFSLHRYESCLSSLNKLLDSRRHDGRVHHNKAVAQYLLSNLTLTDDFRRTLHSVSAQVTAWWVVPVCAGDLVWLFSLIVMLKVATMHRWWSATKPCSSTTRP